MGRDEVGTLCKESERRAAGKSKLDSSGVASDALEDLLNVLADCYGIFPELWLDEEMR